jgi:hypothetical protein
MKDNERILLYDYQRDRNLQPGEGILIFENGNTMRVRESSLYKKEKEPNVRTSVNPTRPSVVRSRAARNVKRRAANLRPAPAGKRLPVFTA